MNWKVKQDNLIDEFIKSPVKIERIMSNLHNKIEGFHTYSTRNFIGASMDLFIRKGVGCELLAPYNKWGEVNRYVKKGEKALHILAPIKHKELKTNEYGEEEEISQLWFKRVPVFDLNQTDGDRLEEILIHTDNTDLCIDSIIEKIPFKVEWNGGNLVHGSTDFNKIYLSSNRTNAEIICTLVHELAHIYCEHDKRCISRGEKELEAETVSFMVSSALGFKNDKAAAYIKNWYPNNPGLKIKGKGSLLIKVSDKIYNLIK